MSDFLAVLAQIERQVDEWVESQVSFIDEKKYAHTACGKPLLSLAGCRNQPVCMARVLSTIMHWFALVSLPFPSLSP